jgi:transposase-like protein
MRDGDTLVVWRLDRLARSLKQLIETRAGLAAARAPGRKGGRPMALSAADLAAAKAMLSDPEITVSEVARRLAISPSTLYRHLPGGRAGIGTTAPRAGWSPIAGLKWEALASFAAPSQRRPRDSALARTAPRKRAQSLSRCEGEPAGAGDACGSGSPGPATEGDGGWA